MRGGAVVVAEQERVAGRSGPCLICDRGLRKCGVVSCKMCFANHGGRPTAFVAILGLANASRTRYDGLQSMPLARQVKLSVICCGACRSLHSERPVVGY